MIIESMGFFAPSLAAARSELAYVGCLPRMTTALTGSLKLVNKVVPHEDLMATAEQYATMILNNSQQAIRSAKETIMDVVGRTLEDALRLETINAYSSLGDFTEARMRLEQFYSKGKTSEKA